MKKESSLTLPYFAREGNKKIISQGRRTRGNNSLLNPPLLSQGGRSKRKQKQIKNFC